MQIQILKGDITTVNCDVIVNAANSSLLGGSGVDGAIHKKAGIKLAEECQIIRNRQGACKTGEAVLTTAGNLNAKFIIHTVGPVWNSGNRDEIALLRSCYTKTLDLFVKTGLTSIAFPSISTGRYKFPKELACEIALESVNNHTGKQNIKNLIFVCYDTENYEIYTKKIGHYDH